MVVKKSNLQALIKVLAVDCIVLAFEGYQGCKRNYNRDADIGEPLL